MTRGRRRRWTGGRRLRDDRGSAVVEFPLVAVLLVAIAVTIIQAAVIIHTRNTLTDAAVQGAHEAAVLDHDPEDGARRAEALVAQRLGSGYAVTAEAAEDPSGRIVVRISATLPLVGLLGPSAALVVEGHAIAEEQL